MASLRDSLFEYRELDEPLRRSMREWWRGAGRNWLIAIAALGFISICADALAQTRFTMSAAEMQCRLVARSAESLLYVTAALAWLTVGGLRIRLLAELSSLAAIPDGKRLHVFAFKSGLLAGWPVLLSFVVTWQLGILADSFSIVDSSIRLANLLEILPQLLNYTMQFCLLCCLALAYRCISGSTALAMGFLAILLASILIFPLNLIVQRGFNLLGVQFQADYDPVVIFLGSCAALLLLIANLLAAGLARRAWAAVALFLLGALRLLELSADLFGKPGSSPELLQKASLELLYGAQLVFEGLPFLYHQLTFSMPDRTFSAMAVQVLWNPAMAIRIESFGELLAILLNLLWLAAVYLFCRWAVGRSAKREN